MSLAAGGNGGVQIGRGGNTHPRDRSRVVHVLPFAEEVAVRPPGVEWSEVEWSGVGAARFLEDRTRRGFGEAFIAGHELFVR